MQQTQSHIARYTEQILELLQRHTREDRLNWTDLMRKLEVRGFAAQTRLFEVVVHDETEIAKVIVRVGFPSPGEGRPANMSCSCEDYQHASTCRHTYATLQLVLKLFRNPKDPLTRAVAIAPLAKAPVTIEPKLLSALDLVLGVEPVPAIKAAPVVENRRLIFRVTWRPTNYGGPLSISPIEQELKKDGTSWKKGRTMRWDELRYSPLISKSGQDQAILAVVTALKPYAYGYAVAPSPFEVVDALVGCHRVYLEDGDSDVPLEVVGGPLGIRCTIKDDKLFVALMCQDSPIDLANGLVGNNVDSNVISLGNGRLTVIRIDGQQGKTLFTELLKMKEGIPLAAAAPLVERFAKLGSLLNVSMPDELFGEPVTGDPRIRLELIPIQPQGLIARFRVSPIAGLVTFPGDSRAASHVSKENSVSRIVRDLYAERTQAVGIIQELEMSRHPALTDWDWRIANDDGVIAFIAQLHDRQKRRLAGPVTQIDSTSSEQPTTTALAVIELTDQLGVIPETDDLIVSWPQGGAMRITSEINSSALRLEVEDQQDWFGLKGTIHVDGHSIPLQALINALKAGRNYVSLGNGLWARISDEFRDRLRAIGDLVQTTSKGMEIDITAVPALQEVVDLKQNLQLCLKWRNLLDRLDAANIQDAEPPIGLNADLRGYQVEGYRWLKKLATWGVGGCLADDMGLGKTVQALAVLLDRMDEGPILVIAPMSVGFNWIRETQRFAPALNVVSYRDADRGEVLKGVGSGDIVIVSYALFQRDAEKFSALEWGTLVLDEAQNIKNAATKTARAVRDLNAKWRLALTGTPIENALSELWALFRAISPGIFGSWERFRDRFAGPIEKAKDPERRFALARLVRPFILRRTKDEVLKELPARTEILRTIELSSEERKRYEDVRLAICTQLAGLDFGTAGKDNRFTVLAAITKLRQLACHPKLVDKTWKKSSAKLDAFLEIVGELREEQHRALVFSQFTQHLGLVRKALDDAKISYQYLDGSSTAQARQKAVDAFQAGEGDLFLISLKAGGSGLNLTAADYVIHLDPWWNPAVEDQATDRAHRIGQTRPVTVYRLVCEDTIEEKILSLHERKRELVESILSGTDEAAKLSTDDLVDLIKGGSVASITSVKSTNPLPEEVAATQSAKAVVQRKAKKKA